MIIHHVPGMIMSEKNSDKIPAPLVFLVHQKNSHETHRLNSNAMNPRAQATQPWDIKYKHRATKLDQWQFLSFLNISKNTKRTMIHSLRKCISKVPFPDQNPQNPQLFQSLTHPKPKTFHSQTHEAFFSLLPALSIVIQYSFSSNKQ